MYDEYMENSNSMESGGMWGNSYKPNDNSLDDYATDNYGTDNYSSLNNESASEDSLLSQIDAFRDKAKELQNLINEREHKISELDNKMSGYQGGMNVGGADISRELDRMIQSVNTSISAITSRLNQQDNTLSNIESRLSAQDGTLSGIDSRLGAQDGTLMGIENRLSQQDGTLANIDNRLSMQDGQQAANVGAPVSDELKGQLDDISGSISKLSADNQAMQDELSEKIHSENVKVYRNLNDVIKENDKGEDNKNAILKKLKSVQTSANLALIFGIFDFAGIGALVYFMLKMTGML